MATAGPRVGSACTSARSVGSVVTALWPTIVRHTQSCTSGAVARRGSTAVAAIALSPGRRSNQTGPISVLATRFVPQIGRLPEPPNATVRLDADVGSGAEERDRRPVNVADHVGTDTHIAMVTDECGDVRTATSLATRRRAAEARAQRRRSFDGDSAMRSFFRKTRHTAECAVALCLLSSGGRAQSVVRVGRLLPVNAREATRGAISPDGRWFAYSVVLAHDRQIWLLDLATGGTRLVTPAPHAVYHGLAWAPDSRHLSYVKDGVDIHVVGVTGDSDRVVFAFSSRQRLGRGYVIGTRWMGDHVVAFTNIEPLMNRGPSEQQWRVAIDGSSVDSTEDSIPQRANYRRMLWRGADRPVARLALRGRPAIIGRIRNLMGPRRGVLLRRDGRSALRRRGPGWACPVVSLACRPPFMRCRSPPTDAWR